MGATFRASMSWLHTWTGAARPAWCGASPVRRLAPLPDPGSWAGIRFLYPFHYALHLRAGGVGNWLVGFAAIAMMAMCVSGVVIHRKLFADFFTLRIFWSFYFPWPLEIAYRGDRQAFNQESLDLSSRPRTGKPAAPASNSGSAARASAKA